MGREAGACELCLMWEKFENNPELEEWQMKQPFDFTTL